MAGWAMIGVPSSAGAHHAGQDRAPAALRAAGLVDRLRSAGVAISDAGDLPVTPFAVDHDHPTARNLAAVVTVARQVAGAVASQLDAGRLPLVAGGDCTITLGLVYAAGDADLSTPHSAGSGLFDSMGVPHMLANGAAELAGLDGPPPLLQP